MVLAFSGPIDRTTDIVARDIFIEALEDVDLVIQVQAQRPINFDSSLQVAQHMETVMRTVISKSSKLRTVVQGAENPRVEVELRDLKAGQRHLLELLQQLGRPKQVSQGSSRGGGAERQRLPITVIDRNATRGGAGTVGERGEAARSVCFRCGPKGHFAWNCDRIKSPTASEGE